MDTFESCETGLPVCERIISVDQILGAYSYACITRLREEGRGNCMHDPYIKLPLPLIYMTLRGTSIKHILVFIVALHKIIVCVGNF